MADSDDPFKLSEATVLRPRPGAGKRAAGDASPAPRSSPPRAVYDETVSSSVREVTAAGLNALVQAASPLLLLAGQLRGTLAVQDIPGLRRHALDEMRRFEERTRALGIQHEVMVGGRYLLCAALDEAVLSTPWGAQSEWAQQPLLVALHREAWGGEKFFDMLERLQRDPGRHMNLLELQYVCLALGFAGKFQVAERGDARLADIKHALFRTIREHREASPPELSLRWKGIQDRRHRLIRYVPWWVIGALALALLASTFTVYYARLGRAAAPVHAALATVGLEEFTGTRTAAPVAGPTLKMLLAADEARGALRVEEEGGRTLVTPLATDLFSSGSATPNPAYVPLLQRVADAINQVSGRVLVEGHTDDQPLASLRYRNNFELSRERAVGVAKILQARAANPARIEWSGAGSSQPRYRPESTPENRARNRRVEIIHVR
jgi:type VI secretion system protein ImpK